MTDFMIWPIIERLPVMGVRFPGEKFEVPSSLHQFHGWEEAMRGVPDVYQYALTPEQHVQYYQELTKKCDWNFDFLL